MATRIEEYADNGNCETMVLVERNGAIDCLRFRREMPSLQIAVPVSPFCQSLSANIFIFTEIRIWRTNRPSRFSKRGDRPSSVREPGMWWTRQRRVREVRAGRIALREPEASCGRTALKVRLVGKSIVVSARPGLPAKRANARTAKSRGPGRRCYGQTPAEVKASPTGRTFAVNSRSEGGQKEFGSRESVT